MNRSAIDMLAGISSKQESTMTTSMPMTPGAAAVVPVKPASAMPVKKKKPKLSDLLMKRELQQEGDDKPVIPTDAKPDETASGIPGEKRKDDLPKEGGPLEAPIETSVALVAPDTTPNAEVPLDPSQVPQPASSEVATISSPTPVDDGTDVLRTLIGQHQEHFKPELITDPAAAAAAVTRMLNGNAAEASKSDTASAKAAEVLSEAQSGKKQVPHHNPESLNRSIAVTRHILGM